MLAVNAPDAMQARQEQILGQPPRIPPIPSDEFTAEMQESTRMLRIAAGVPPEGDVPEYVATVLRHPSLYRAHTSLALLLMSGGALTARDREMAVLRIGWLCGAPFEWGEHVIIGKRACGFTPEEVERLTVGSAAPGWTDSERALLRAVEELLDDAMISDETWAALARDRNEQQLIELPLLIGQYLGVAYLQNALRIRMLPGNPGLSSR